MPASYFAKADDVLRRAQVKPARARSGNTAISIETFRGHLHKTGAAKQAIKRLTTR
jgi:hypothetical protein